MSLRSYRTIPRAPCPSRYAFTLVAWGPYEPCPPFIPEDIDQDCEVGFSDLLAVLAAWGPCKVQQGEPDMASRRTIVALVATIAVLLALNLVKGERLAEAQPAMGNGEPYVVAYGNGL